MCRHIWIGLKGKNLLLKHKIAIKTFTNCYIYCEESLLKLLSFLEVLKLFFQDCFIYFVLNFIFGFWAKKYLINVCVPTLFPWKSHSGVQTDALQILRVLRGSNSVKCWAFPVFPQDHALLVQFPLDFFQLSQTLCGVLQKYSSQFLSFQNFPEGNSTHESKYTFAFIPIPVPWGEFELFCILVKRDYYKYEVFSGNTLLTEFYVHTQLF